MIELIPLQPEYCEAVAEIARESLPEHWSLRGIQDVLRYDNNRYFVARQQKEDKVIIGFAGIMLIAEEAELLNIAVKPAFWGQGIGQQLLEKMIFEAAAGEAVRLLLEVRKSNTSAIHLYQKNRFHVLGERKNYYSAPTEDAIIMERRLNDIY